MKRGTNEGQILVRKVWLEVTRRVEKRRAGRSSLGYTNPGRIGCSLKVP